LQSTQKKKIRRFSFQPGLRGSIDLHVGQKMATFQLFFQSGRAKDLSAPLYKTTLSRIFHQRKCYNVQNESLLLPSVFLNA